MKRHRDKEIESAVGAYVEQYLSAHLGETRHKQAESKSTENDLAMRVSDYLVSLLEAVERYAGKAPKAAITLASYAGRLGLRHERDETGWTQKPYDEFFVLLHILTETEGEIEAADRELVSKAIESLCGFQKLSPQAVKDRVLEALHQDGEVRDQLCAALSRLGIAP